MVPTNLVIPIAIAPNEIPLSRSIIPLKFALPRLSDKAEPILPRALAIPLPIFFMTSQSA